MQGRQEDIGVFDSPKNPGQAIGCREKMTLRFDCKACEMHVMGKMRPGVAEQTRKEMTKGAGAVPITFFAAKPVVGV